MRARRASRAREEARPIARYPGRGLADHIHFELPVWRDLLQRMGAVRGTRETCAQLFEAGEAVLVFPGGAREVMKHKHERYQLIWKERIGFAHLAIRHGVPIVPFASVGVEDMFEVVADADADDVLRSPVGDLLRALGITKQSWFRHGEILPPIARGRRPVPQGKPVSSSARSARERRTAIPAPTPGRSRAASGARTHEGRYPPEARDHDAFLTPLVRRTVAGRPCATQ